MRKVLFLHGFFASGNCRLAQALLDALAPEIKVLTPDLPLHPQTALQTIKTLCEKERPDILVGNSCGSFYAQIIASQLHLPALLGNPHLQMTVFLSSRIGQYQYKSPRENGHNDLTINETLINEFATVTAHQFDYYTPENKDLIWGLFGDDDSLAHYEPLFLQYYSRGYHFPGAHTPTYEEALKYYVPLVREPIRFNERECSTNIYPIK